jgi:hypothetical protein
MHARDMYHMKLYLASHFHLLQAKSKFKKLGAIRMALIKNRFCSEVIG